MWSPPICTLRSGLRACSSNCGGAFATCSRIQSGSNLTSSPSTSWPAALKVSSASSYRNSIPRSLTMRRQPPPDDAFEAADEEVGEEVRRRLVLGAVHLVAVRAGETLEAGEVGAAVRVRDDDLVALRGLLDRGADALGAVVQLRRHGAHL